MKLGNKNVFPLSTLSPRYNGYYMDANGDVYSTKKNVTGTLVSGTSSDTRNKYYTMNGYRVSKAVLIRTAKAHPAFKIETATFFPVTTPVTRMVAAVPAKKSSNTVEVVKKDSLADYVGIAKINTVTRSYAKDVEEGISLRGTVIASVKDGKLVFSSEPKIHITEKSYRAEMERLAVLTPGVKYVALAICGTALAGGVKWE